MPTAAEFRPARKPIATIHSHPSMAAAAVLPASSIQHPAANMATWKIDFVRELAAIVANYS